MQKKSFQDTYQLRVRKRGRLYFL